MSSSVALPDRLLTRADVADLLGVSPDTVKFWRRHGRGPHGFLVGRHLRFHPDDVAEWIETQKDAAA